MKIRNLAFCGVMASILTGWGASADTIIASKAYVDARDATKQNSADRVEDTWANSTADHSSTTKYPSMNTLDTAISGLNTSIGSGALTTNVLADGVDGTKLTKASAITAAKDATKLSTVSSGVVSISAGADDKFPTTKAVADTIKDLDHKTATAVSGASSVVTGVSQTDGQVTVTNGTLGFEAIAPAVVKQATDGSVEAHNAGGAKYYGDHTVLSDSRNGIKSWATATDSETDADEKALYNIRNSKALDRYVPTMAAVEARVQEIATASSDTYADRNLSNLNAAGNTVIDNRIDTKINALDATGVDNSSTGVPILKVTEADGVVTVAGGQVKEAGIEDSAVTSAKIADGTIVNADISSSAAIDFTKMSDALNDVNSTSAASCTAGSPCVLTFYKIGTTKYYKWTNMDTESTSANPSSNS